MKWQTVEEHWNQFKGAVKAKWSNLTDLDLAYIEGRKDRLLAEIQQRYLLTRDEAEQDITEFLEAQGQVQDQDTDPMQAPERPAPHTPGYR